VIHVNILYTAEATATGAGRAGRVRSTDGLIDTDLAVPADMGGPGGATNPEQLFAAGYAGCFHNALRLVARRAKVDLSESAVTARVGIGPDGAGGYTIAVTLRVTTPGVEHAVAEQLIAKTREVCPYSKATRGNIDTTIELVDPEPAAAEPA
jgi:Ohr subfamily peroxiredoxin